MGYFTFFIVVLLVVLAADAAKVERVRRALLTEKVDVKGLARHFFGNLEEFGFRRDSTQTFHSASGVLRERLIQTFSGLDVVGTAAEAEALTDDEFSGHVYGTVAKNIDDDIQDAYTCMRTDSEMIDIAIKAEGFESNDEYIRNKIVKRCVRINPNTHKAQLAYYVEFVYKSAREISRPTYYIDACDDSVITSYNQINNATISRQRRMDDDRQRRVEDDQCETDPPVTTTVPPPEACSPSAVGVGGNIKVGQVNYNTPPRCLPVQKNGDQCVMSNEYVKTVDNERSRDYNRQTAISFNCNEGYGDEVNGAYGPANDAFFYGTITGRLYQEKYGIRALDWTPRLVIHFDDCYDNAFWNGRDMFFGDGCSYFYPLVSQDVVTHELGHGITSENSKLEYRSQSGGINEAFSDISGEVSEVFASGNNDWFVGYSLFKNRNALRYFINPGDDGRSIKHVDQYTSGLDVHYSSGLFNHAFYQMVEIEKMGIYEAYECFLEANLMIWTATSTFDQGACGVMQACYDNGYNVNKVKNAFSVVGIDLESCNYDALSVAMNVGETRETITVSSNRNPIIQVITNSAPIIITATADTAIEICGDSLCAGGDIVKGSDAVTFDASNASQVFVRLSNSSPVDIKGVQMEVTEPM